MRLSFHDKDDESDECSSVQQLSSGKVTFQMPIKRPESSISSKHAQVINGQTTQTNEQVSEESMDMEWEASQLKKGFKNFGGYEQESLSRQSLELSIINLPPVSYPLSLDELVQQYSNRLEQCEAQRDQLNRDLKLAKQAKSDLEFASSVLKQEEEKYSFYQNIYEEYLKTGFMNKDLWQRTFPEEYPFE